MNKDKPAVVRLNVFKILIKLGHDMSRLKNVTFPFSFVLNFKFFWYNLVILRS